MLARFTRIVKGMTVDEARMRRNLDLGRGLVFSGQLLLELTARGMRREDAYRVVQAHAMEAWKSEGDFRERVHADPEIRAVLVRGGDRRGVPARALPHPRRRDLRPRLRRLDRRP